MTTFSLSRHPSNSANELCRSHQFIRIILYKGCSIQNVMKPLHLVGTLDFSCMPTGENQGSRSGDLGVQFCGTMTNLLIRAAMIKIHFHCAAKIGQCFFVLKLQMQSCF